MNTPILILFFNRKDTVTVLIKQLSKIKPTVLFLSSDGGRSNEEHKQVIYIREMVLKAITWECEIHTNFSEINLGCKYAVHSAVQWFFKNVPEGIILEDDCIPSEPFFEYATNMLREYRHEKSIATIGGRNELPEFRTQETIFSSKFFCWGWASWADRINTVNIECGYSNKLPKKLFANLGFFESQHIKGIHQIMLKKLANSWAYSYDFSFRIMNQMHIVSPVNYIHNIGLESGAHTKNKNIINDPHQASDKRYIIERDPNPKKTEGYIENYLLSKYGLLKLLLFPRIAQIKSIMNLYKSP